MLRYSSTRFPSRLFIQKFTANYKMQHMLPQVLWRTAQTVFYDISQANENEVRNLKEIRVEAAH